MDRFVRYRVGKNEGYAKVIEGPGGKRYGMIGKKDFELSEVAFLRILSNDYTRDAAIEVSPGVCLVGEVRFISFDEDKWEIFPVKAEEEVAKCAGLSSREALAYNRKIQNGKLVDILEEIHHGTFDYDMEQKERVKECVEGSMLCIGFMDTEYRQEMEAYGRFVRYKDHENTGLAEIVSEDEDSITIKYLTNEGTNDAAYSLNLSANRMGADHICVVGSTREYGKGDLQRVNVEISLAKEGKDLRHALCLSKETDSLLKELMKQKVEITKVENELYCKTTAMSDIDQALMGKIAAAKKTITSVIMGAYNSLRISEILSRSSKEETSTDKEPEEEATNRELLPEEATDKELFPEEAATRGSSFEEEASEAKLFLEEEREM